MSIEQKIQYIRENMVCPFKLNESTEITDKELFLKSHLEAILNENNRGKYLQTYIYRINLIYEKLTN